MDGLPVGLSLVAMLIWLLVFGGIIDHWRTHHPLPTAVVASVLLVVAASVTGRLLEITDYIEPSAGTVLWAHFERALLVTTGVYALAVLLRSRLRW